MIASNPLVAITIAAAIQCASPPAIATEIAGQVAGVADGDSLTVLIAGKRVRIRLVDIDAPELSQAFGKESKNSLSGICANKPARVATQGNDRYGRTLGRVTCDGIDANAEQVRRGMAWVYVRFAPKDSPLYELQTKARIERAGLWRDVEPVAPWEWRRTHSRSEVRPPPE